MCERGNNSSCVVPIKFHVHKTYAERKAKKNEKTKQIKEEKKENKKKGAPIVVANEAHST